MLRDDATGNSFALQLFLMATRGIAADTNLQAKKGFSRYITPPSSGVNHFLGFIVFEEID